MPPFNTQRSYPNEFDSSKSNRNTNDSTSHPERRTMVLDATTLRREGQPEEVAYGVLYLASDESSFVTGTELVIGRGFTAG
ncbi:MAG: SDR family oxidoreductase [Candidatus Binatia bacterium]